MRQLFITLICVLVVGSAVGIPRVQGATVGPPSDSNGTYSRYTLLAPSIIGKNSGEDVTFDEYFDLAYKAFLTALIALGILNLMYSGFQYILTESVPIKNDARQRITDTLIGLALALASVLILRTINPDLVTINLFKAGQ